MFFAERRVTNQCSHIDFQLPGHAVDDRVAFRVNSRIIERLVAAPNSEETSCLLECLVAQFCDRCQLSSIRKSSAGVAKRDDILGELGADPGDERKQRCARHVQVDAHIVNARLDNAIQAFSELYLINVVLVLADSDGLRIELHQFREGMRVSDLLPGPTVILPGADLDFANAL